MSYEEPDEIVLQLGFRDVYLDFFVNQGRKNLILRSLCSGDPLEVRGNRLYSPAAGRETPLCQLSRKSQLEIQKNASRGFVPTSASVRFIVAWRPKNAVEKEDYAVLLPTIVLNREH